MIKEFKEFAMKGNVIDLAVGLIIGGAFGKIVTSFVNDILMPLLSPLIGGINFADKSFILKEATGDVEAIVLNYGQFINVTVDFLIVSFAIFIVIRQMNKLKKKEEEKPEKEKIAGPTEIELLIEIRDSLKK